MYNVNQNDLDPINSLETSSIYKIEYEKEGGKRVPNLKCQKKKKKKLKIVLRNTKRYKIWQI